MPTTENRFGERLFAVNLARLMEVGTPMISEVVMGLVYGRKLGKSGLAFLRTRSFSLGDGRRINFWKDVWCGEEALCSSYPSLFNLALNKEATVVNTWDSDKGEGCWSPTFLRLLNNWEIEEMERFLQTLCNQNFCPSNEDRLLLKDVREKGFSVKIMYKGLDPSPTIEFPYCSVWNPVVPPKIGFFMGSYLG